MNQCLVSGGSSPTEDAVIYAYGTATLTNCTIAGNGDQTASFRFASFTTANLYNCIVVKDGGEPTVFADGATVNAYNTLSTYTGWSNTAEADNGNLTYDSAKSLFVDAENGDYHLTEDSQAKNAGNNDRCTDTIDLDGNKRLMYTTIDLGAYEYQYTFTPYEGTFDGGYHGVVALSAAEFEAEPGTVSYIVDGVPVTTPQTYRAVGTYDIWISVARVGYKDYTQRVTSTIEPATVTITEVRAQDKTYDAKTAAEVRYSKAGLISGTEAQLEYTAEFENKNADEGKTVSIRFEITGQDHSNYEIVVDGKAYTPETYKPWIVTVTDTADISKESLTVNGTSVAPKFYDGTTDAGNITVGMLSGAITGDAVSIASATGTFDDGKDAGEAKSVTVVYTLTGDDAENYTVENTEYETDITPRPVTLTSATDSKTYDGTPLTNSTVTVTGFVGEEGVTCNVTGSQTTADSSKNAFTYEAKDSTNLNNYAITKTEGTLTVTQNNTTIIVTANSASKTYDGTALTDSGYTVTGTLAAGDYFASVTVEGTITNVGDAANEVTDWMVRNQAGDDVTGCYSGIRAGNDGTLSITPREVTLTSASCSKAYDGTPLTDSGVTVTGSGFAGEEGVTCNVTGSQTAVGTSENAFDYAAKAGTELSNYAITSVKGTLAVTYNAAEITVTANSASKTYDGTPLTDSGYTVTGALAANDYFASVTVEGTITNAGTAANKVTGYVIKNQAGDNVTGCYSGIGTADGALSISERIVVLTSGSAEKTYDGTPLTAETVTVSGEGFANGEGITASGYASITSAGEVSNSFSYTLNPDTLEANYDWNIVEGTLKVKPLCSDLHGEAIGEVPAEAIAALEAMLDNATETAARELVNAEAYNGNGSEPAASETIAKVLGDTGYVEVLLKGFGFDSEASELNADSKIVTARFEVTPYDSDGNPQSELDEEVDFQLPLISTEWDYAHVYHDGQFFKQITVDKNSTNLHIFSNKFSEYSYTLTNTNIYAVYSASTDYAVTVEEAEHGTVTADLEKAASGKTVTLTVEADKGWTPETITVLDKNDREIELTNHEDGSYTFVMPASAVTVKATFMEDNTMLNFFVDVKAEDYFYDAVLWAAENGITSGVDETHFNPSGITTRAQMVTFLWRAAGEPVVNYAMSFTDVPADAYYTEAVRWAVSEGITNGVGGDRFAPDAPVDRAQVVTFLYRWSKAPAFANMTANGPAPSPFEDVATDAYYYNAVLWAVGQEVTKGTGDGKFSPANACTRGEVVTFLCRYCTK